MLDLVRLSRKRLFPPGGAELYRQIALLTDMSPGLEVLDVASGKGVPLEYFVKEFGVTASGVDIDPTMVEEADEWSRELGAGQRLQFQSGRSDALPYRDEIFDVAIGEIGLANHCHPKDAIRELVRVTKPGGFIVLVQLVWKAPVDEERRAVLSEHLGARPLMVVEWKRLLREAGVEDVHVEDWSDEETSFRPTVVKPFPDFAEMFSLGERMSILQRAWKRWGWRGVSSAIARENAVHNLLTGERILGLDLLRGRKAGGKEAPEVAPAAVAEPRPASTPSIEGETPVGGRAPSDSGQEVEGDTREDHADTVGLPLFGDADETHDGDEPATTPRTDREESRE
ncbi:MAG: methyltransferase domain-containing protein [Gemmatimonadota bacterium]|nr:methyltransferase domain-containing protein [Gemmatimonadota bacterium]MDH3424367.1 methyltransferase domain-containing protein [Gemmatimonadota bacterium]